MMAQANSMVRRTARRVLPLFFRSNGVLIFANLTFEIIPHSEIAYRFQPLKSKAENYGDN